MAMKCTVCGHPSILQINESLISGVPNRRIATQYGLSEASVRRHHDNHIPATIAKAKEAEIVTHADNLLDDLQHLKSKALSLLNQAEAELNFNAAASLIGQARQVIETLAEVRGELNRQQQINILINPEYVQMRSVILRSVQNCPECRKRISEALNEVS